jgi:hypothetical protein
MRNKYILIGLVGIVVGVLLASVVVVLAGTNFDSPSVPTDSASQMYTLEQVYDRANDGTAATKMTTFTEPSGAPAATMYDLNALYTLVSERSRPAKTGQTDCYYDDGSTGTCTCGDTNCPSGQDGDLEKGVSWPGSRFTDNSDGTVTDNLTGLIWLENANCDTFFSGDGTGQNNRSWANALTAANSLEDGYCGLSDGSSAGDWRLPNVREMQSLVHYGVYDPAVPNTAGTGKWTSGDPFTGVQSSYYWSSTTCADDTTVACFVHLRNGSVDGTYKSIPFVYVWPVRGGQ